MDLNKSREIVENILLSSNVEESIIENEELLFQQIPELKSEKGFEQRSKWHCYDVWYHTIHAIKNSAMKVDVRVILLLHDIGKSFSFQDEGDSRHFKGHAEKSAEMAETILKRLGYSDDETKEYCFYIRNHATTISRDMLNDYDIEKCRKLLQIQYSDASAYAPEYTQRIKEKLDGIKTLIEKND